MSDPDVLGCTEAYLKYVNRSKLVEEHFDFASVIDINNHVRQGALSLETAWKTQTWSSRVISTLLGIIETDAYLIWHHFHPYGKNWDHASFTTQLSERNDVGLNSNPTDKADAAQTKYELPGTCISMCKPYAEHTCTLCMNKDDCKMSDKLFLQQKMIN